MSKEPPLKLLGRTFHSLHGRHGGLRETAHFVNLPHHLQIVHQVFYCLKFFKTDTDHIHTMLRIFLTRCFLTSCFLFLFFLNSGNMTYTIFILLKHLIRLHSTPSREAQKLDTIFLPSAISEFHSDEALLPPMLQPSYHWQCFHHACLPPTPRLQLQFRNEYKLH